MTNKTFDLREVDVAAFLKELEVRNITDETESEIRFSCPFPGHASGDENPSAYMNRHTTAWFCHGCKRKGNAINFMADLHNLSNVQSFRFLRERFGAGFQEPNDTLENEILNFFFVEGKPTAQVLNYPLQEAVLSDFYVDEISVINYMQQRGFSSDIYHKFQIGYDRKSGRMTIPIFDGLGRLVGFKGRSLDPDLKPKYKVLGGSQYGFPRYHVGHVIYALDKVSEDVNAVIVVEGELNAIAMHQMGYNNTVSAGGSNFTEIQARQLIERFETVILFFDSDEAGNKATAHAVKLLERNVRVMALPEHELDPADVIETYEKLDEQRQYIDLLLSDQVDTLLMMFEDSNVSN